MRYDNYIPQYNTWKAEANVIFGKAEQIFAKTKTT